MSDLKFGSEMENFRSEIILKSKISAKNTQKLSALSMRSSTTLNLASFFQGYSKLPILLRLNAKID